MDADALRSLFDLSGRVVVVTGGTRGIGLAIAEGFLAATVPPVPVAVSAAATHAAGPTSDSSDIPGAHATGSTTSLTPLCQSPTLSGISPSS